MSDNIERFIRDNREGFDTQLPGKKNWAEIEKQIGKPKAPATYLLDDNIKMECSCSYFYRNNRNRTLFV